MEQTLLLNATYEPLKIVHWQKAVTLWCQGKVEVISVYDREIRAVSFSFKLPSVIRLLRYIRIKRRFDYVPFSRANIYARDDYTCQYCGEPFPMGELTVSQILDFFDAHQAGDPIIKWQIEFVGPAAEIVIPDYALAKAFRGQFKIDWDSPQEARERPEEDHLRTIVLRTSQRY